jgi:RNA polymerase sigma-54 factor
MWEINAGKQLMAMDLRPHLRPELRPIITVQLQQSLKLLALSRGELVQNIRNEVGENPTLEMDEPANEEAAISERAQSANAAGSFEPALDQEERARSIVERLTSPEWDTYINNHSNERHDIGFLSGNDGEQDELASRVAAPGTLEAHLLLQLQLSRFSEREARIGCYVVSNLDNNGYLAVTLQDICETMKCTPDETESVLQRVRFFDPVGVASRDLRECLLTQLENRGLADSVAARIVATCLEQFASKRYDKIGRELGVAIEEIAKATRIIVSLEPKPARGYTYDLAQRVEPDVFVEKRGGEYVITLNDDGMPRLRLRANYQPFSGQLEGADAEKMRQYLKERASRAKWLIDAIAQRQKTLLRVTESIFKFQREFLDRGKDYVRPLGASGSSGGHPGA